MSAVIQEVPKPLKLDLGCGKNKREGFIGVDSRSFEGVDVVCDLSAKTWTVAKEDDLRNKSVPLFASNDGDEVGEAYIFHDESVDEVHCSHFVEHLTATGRINFVNEIYRVLRKGGKATLITPHWASCRAYGDLTHQWPPVSEFWFYYLSKDWREQNAPHNDQYACDFEATWGYGMHQSLLVKNTEMQQFAMQFYKEAVQDLHATLIKK